MPTLEVLEHRDTFALEGFGNDGARLIAAIAPAFFEGVEDLGIVVPVDCQCKPSECAEFLCESVDIELIHGPLALSQTVNIDNSVQVGCFVIMRQSGRFPDGSFGAFAVAEKDIGVVRNFIETGGESIAQSRGEPLTQRAGGDVHPWHSRSWMAFENAVETAQRQKIFFLDDSAFRVRRPQQRGGMAFRQYKSIICRVVRILRIES